MTNGGLWRLFFLTGLPEVYLALRAEEIRPAAVPAFGEYKGEWDAQQHQSAGSAQRRL